MICLDTDILDKLSPRGILAYVSVTLAGDVKATSASLAALVRAPTAAMTEGLHELSAVAPGVVRRDSKMKWDCGKPQPENVVQILDSDWRRKEFIDDLKKSWDWANKATKEPFNMGGRDGIAIRNFLRQHKDWDQVTWRRALRNRFKSEAIVNTQPLYAWVGKLAEYLEAPLDRYGRPMGQFGGGKHGEALTIRERNRQAVERAAGQA